MLSTKGTKESKNFLVKDPEEWQVDLSYEKLYEHVKLLKVVSDTGECGMVCILKNTNIL